MSKQKRTPRPPRKEKIYQIQNEHLRQELAWRYGEEDERHLELVRKILIGVWLFASFVLAFTLGNENQMVIVAGVVAGLLVIAYQARVIWVTRATEKRIAAELGESLDEE